MSRQLSPAPRSPFGRQTTIDPLPRPIPALPPHRPRPAISSRVSTKPTEPEHGSARQGEKGRLQARAVGEETVSGKKERWAGERTGG